MFKEAQSQLGSVRDLLRFAVSRFNEAGLAFGHGSINAYDEAAYLILYTLRLPPDTLDPFLDARLLPEEIERVLKVLGRRINERIPAAYLTHEAWLGEHRFYVDERVLIPRSFIAELLREKLAVMIDEPLAIHRALDLCTGCGCLAVLIAQTFPNAQVDAADISKSALEVAKCNVADYAFNETIRLIESDLFAQLAGSRYDLIVCNPPYVNAAAMAALPQEYHYEPQAALAGGADGLDIIRRVLAGSADHLTDGGMVVIECGHNRPTVERAFPQLKPAWLEASGGEDCVFASTRKELERWTGEVR